MFNAQCSMFLHRWLIRAALFPVEGDADAGLGGGDFDDALVGEFYGEYLELAGLQGCRDGQDVFGYGAVLEGDVAADLPPALVGGGEADAVAAHFAGALGQLHVVHADDGVGVVGVRAVAQGEAVAYLIYIRAHVAHAIAGGVDHYCCGTVGHVEGYEEVQVLVGEHFHFLACCEQAGAVAVDGVAFCLHECGGGGVVITVEAHAARVGDVGQREVCVFFHRQVDGVACLVGVHLLNLVLLELVVGAVERQVDVGCELSEDALRQLVAQRVGNHLVGLRVEHRAQLGLYVRHQMQRVVDRVVLTAVGEVIVNRAARGHRCCKKKQQGIEH